MSAFRWHFVYCFLPRAEAIIGKLENIGNEEKDAKPMVVIAAHTVCLSFPLWFYSLHFLVDSCNLLNQSLMLFPCQVLTWTLMYIIWQVQNLSRFMWSVSGSFILSLRAYLNCNFSLGRKCPTKASWQRGCRIYIAYYLWPSITHFLDPTYQSFRTCLSSVLIIHSLLFRDFSWLES